MSSALLLAGSPLSVLAAELFGSQEEGGGADAHALGELQQQLEARVELTVLQRGDARRIDARGGGQIAGADAVMLAQLSDCSAEDEEILLLPLGHGGNPRKLG